MITRASSPLKIMVIIAISIVQPLAVNGQILTIEKSPVDSIKGIDEFLEGIANSGHFAIDKSNPTLKIIDKFKCEYGPNYNWICKADDPEHQQSSIQEIRIRDIENKPRLLKIGKFYGNFFISVDVKLTQQQFKDRYLGSWGIVKPFPPPPHGTAEPFTYERIDFKNNTVTRITYHVDESTPGRLVATIGASVTNIENQ